MFEKTATDLIREIRSKKFSIQTTLAEIQSEITRSDTRGNAIQKCCILHLLGYDLQWTVFHVIECMSSHKPVEKRIGYSAAALCFSQETPMLMLCTNLIKKDLSSNLADGAMALHTLCQIANRDLARDLHHDVVTLLNHSNPYMRKRAVITLYKLFLKYPDAIGEAFPRLKDRLDDEDSSVVCAAVTVICEMSATNPKAYLPFVPQLFGLLSINHNWTLIKVVKLFARLSPHEPRLAKKLQKPLRELVSKTRAMSLLYEVVHTIITGGLIRSEGESNGIDLEGTTDELGVLCLEKLLLFLEQADQNLKFLGLDALGKLLKIRPSTGSNHREIILKCLEDGDISIRNRALELVTTLVTEKSLFSIVKKLIVHLTSSSTSSFSNQEVAYRSKVVSTILSQCSKDNYANLSNFEWFVSVLCDLATFNGLQKSIGKQLKDNLIEICVRVPEIRSYAIGLLAPMLNNEKLILAAKSPQNLCEFLYGAAWVCGEYADSEIESILPALISPKILSLSSSIQAVYLFSFLKLSSRYPLASSSLDSNAFDYFINCLDLNVQERASVIKMIWADNKMHLDANGNSDNPWTEKVPWIYSNLTSIFANTFNMVAPSAQEKLPITLDLDTWLVPLKPEDIQLDSSPTRMANESVESLTAGIDGTEEEDVAESGEKEEIEGERVKMATPTLGSSVLQKPSPKKYTLVTKFDGQELVDHGSKTPHEASTPREKKSIKKERHPSASKESRFLVPDLHRYSFTVDVNANRSIDFKVVATFDHSFKDLLITELAINIKISTEPNYPAKLLIQSIELPTNEIRCVSKRKDIESSFFHSKLAFQVQVGKEVVDVELALPFIINIVHPKFNRKMTHEKFLDILLNPPHALDKVIKKKTKENSVASATQKIAREMYCVYQLFQDAGSLLGMTVKKQVFLGLVKLENGMVSVEFKTRDDLELSMWLERSLDALFI